MGRIDEIAGLAARIEEIVSRLPADAAPDADPAVPEAVADLHEAVSALRREIMLTRTIAVGDLFRRYPRMVRDLGRELGKDVALMLEGTEVELDRAVVARIADPIVHLLRNAVDHGIERPAERVAAGKAPRGTVRLGAALSGGDVLVTVSDDGAGMDAEEIWEEALHRGLVHPVERAHYDEEDVRLLACRPGFTTVRTPTHVSGHGVGLDVVAGTARELGGTLTVRSVPGRGTTFSMRLPLWLGRGGRTAGAPTLFPAD